MATQNFTSQNQTHGGNQLFIGSTIFDNASNQIASVSPPPTAASSLRSARQDTWIINTIIRDINNQVIGNINGLGQIYTSVLGGAGRIIATVNPLSYRNSVVWDAASQRVASINALGNAASSVYSANGSLIASQSELGFLTSFILDAASQRICVVDANNGRSTTIFSNRGYVTATQDQLGALTTFNQDSNGNTILRVDARSWPTTYAVDQLNRTAQTQYIDSTRVTNSWDSAGQLVVVADTTGITTNVWDSDSRKVAVQNPTGINLTSTLDPIGNRLVLKDNFGSTSYTWDQQSRLLSIWNPLNETTTIQWDNLDREQHRVLGNGGTISHTWDAAGRETLIENRDKNGVGQFIATNTYSPVDNRLTVLELDSTRATYAYDVASQIVNEARGGTMAYARSYVWDSLGNRIQQYDSGVLTTGTFNKANQLTLLTPASGPTTVSSYDSNGNLVLQNSNGALTTQTWSPENRLASYSDPAGNNEQFLYSDDGLKKQRTNASGVTLFTYDEAALLLETSSTLALQARYTNSPQTWGGLASQSRSGVSSFYGIDSQMSARILVSMAGVITDSYSYKAFGEELQSGSGTVNVYRYGALVLYYRELADLINTWHRWPQPSTGRFRSPDVLGFAGGSWGLYEFAENNPVIFYDPTGLQASAPAPAFGGAVGTQIRDTVNKGFDCTIASQSMGSIPGTNAWPTIAKSVLKELMVCLASQESSLNPKQPKHDCVGKACWGLYSLGTAEEKLCGIPKGKHSDQMPTWWQTSCVMKKISNQCSVRSLKNQTDPTVIPSLLGAFDYFGGFVKFGDVSAYPNLTKCMTAANYPNWWGFLKSMPCNPCSSCLTVNGNPISIVSPSDPTNPDPIGVGGVTRPTAQ